MDYQISITRREKNPDYVKPKGFDGIMRQSYENASEYVKYEVMSVELTPEQFSAIRKAVLEHF